MTGAPWVLVPLTRDQAVAFVHLHHRHCGRPASHRGALGLQIAGELRGVVMLGNTCRAMMQADPLMVEVTRLCVADGSPLGSCSWLYARARRLASALGFQRVTTCTLDEESGASLRGAGWEPTAKLHARAGYDCPSRRRKALPTDNRAKVRWKVTA